MHKKVLDIATGTTRLQPLLLICGCSNLFLSPLAFSPYFLGRPSFPPFHLCFQANWSWQGIGPSTSAGSTADVCSHWSLTLFPCQAVWQRRRWGCRWWRRSKWQGRRGKCPPCPPCSPPPHPPSPPAASTSPRRSAVLSPLLLTTAILKTRTTSRMSKNSCLATWMCDWNIIRYRLYLPFYIVVLIIKIALHCNNFQFDQFFIQFSFLRSLGIFSVTK